MTHTFLRKIRRVVVIILVVFLVAPVALFTPQKAEAILSVPSIDFLDIGQNTVSAIENIWNTLKEGGLDGAAWIVAKQLLKQMSGQLIGWINSGFEGSPAFISDPGSFLLGVGDAVAGNFIYGNSDLRFLCDPIGMGIDIRLALGLKYFGSFKQTSSCTLSQVIGNIENARLWVNAGVNTRAAVGWQSWLAMTQVPQNNVYGAYARAEAELNARVTGSRALNKQVADWGQGFKSLTKPLSSGLQKIVTPGNTIKASLDKSLAGNQEALAAADELVEMINGVAGALLNQLFLKGLAGLSSGGENSYANQLRTDTDTYVPPAIPTNYETIDTTRDTATQQHQVEIDKVPPIDAGGGGFIPVQKSKIYLAEQAVDADCPFDTNHGGVKAVDGSKDSYYDSCDNSKIYWQITLDTPLPLDEVRMYFATEETSLKSRTVNNVVEQPYLTLTDYTGATHVVNNLTTNQTTVVVTLPEALRTIPMKTVRLTTWSGGKGVFMQEFELYRHLLPEVDVSNLPSSIASTTASVSPGINPRNATANPKWVVGYYYPLYSDRQPIPTPPGNTVIQVTVKKISDNTTIAPSVLDNPATTDTDELLYILPAGEVYQFEYIATYQNLDSAKITKNVTVPR